MNFSQPAFYLLFLPIVVFIFRYLLLPFRNMLETSRTLILNYYLIFVCLGYYLLLDLMSFYNVVIISGLTFLICKSFNFKRSAVLICICLFFYLFLVKALVSSEIIFKQVPLGLSFYTFQIILLLFCLISQHLNFTIRIDRFLLYVLFFPQTILGPIVNYSVFEKWFAKSFRAKTQISWQRFELFFVIFVLALSKKVLIADELYNLVNPVFEGQQWVSLSSFDRLIICFANCLALYFDFSAYSEMAFALAILFGLRLPVNFLSPLRTTNYVDFWRCWHITLTRTLGEVLNLPIARLMLRLRVFHASTLLFLPAISITLTFVMSGWWHGFGWSFILWGLLNSFFWLICRTTIYRNLVKSDILGWFITQLAFAIILLLFRLDITNFFSFLTTATSAASMTLSIKSYIVFSLTLVVALFGFPLHQLISDDKVNHIFTVTSNLLQKYFFSFVGKFWFLILFMLLALCVLRANNRGFYYYAF